MNTRLHGVSWQGSECPVILDCNKKQSVIVIVIIGHNRNRAQDTPLAAHPPRPDFYGLAVKYLFSGCKFLKNEWSIQVLTCPTSETSQTLRRVWGLVRKPHHWVSCEYMNCELCKHFSDSPPRPRLEPRWFPQLYGLRPVCMSTPSSGAEDSGGYSPRPGRWPM